MRTFFCTEIFLVKFLVEFCVGWVPFLGNTLCVGGMGKKKRKFSRHHNTNFQSNIASTHVTMDQKTDKLFVLQGLNFKMQLLLITQLVWGVPKGGKKKGHFWAFFQGAIWGSKWRHRKLKISASDFSCDSASDKIKNRKSIFGSHTILL